MNVASNPKIFTGLEVLKSLKFTIVALDFFILFCAALIPFMSGYSGIVNMFLIFFVAWPLLSIALLAYCYKMHDLLAPFWHNHQNRRLHSKALKVFLIIAIIMTIILIPLTIFLPMSAMLGIILIPCLGLAAILIYKSKDDALLLNDLGVCPKESKTAKRLTCSNRLAIKLFLVAIVAIFLYVCPISETLIAPLRCVEIILFYIVISVALIAQLVNTIIFCKTLKKLYILKNML